MALIQFEAFSDVLGKAFTAHIALPETARGPFPVLWLLHGAGDNGSGWLRHTAIERQATRRDLALVAPTAGMSMYEDMAHGQRYFTHIADELPKMLRRLLPQRELLRQVGENARRELYISWDTSVANACRRYEVVLDNFRRGVYPARDTRVDELLLDTAESLDAINRLRAIPQQLRAAMDEDVRQWHDEIQENRLNARENRQKLQEKLSQLRQQIDRYL